MKDNHVEGKCVICKGDITHEQIKDSKVEMIIGPEGKKVFIHNYHAGVEEQVKKEYKEK